MYLDDIIAALALFSGFVSWEGQRAARTRASGSHYSTRRTAYWPWFVSTLCAFAVPWFIALRVYLRHRS